MRSSHDELPEKQTELLRKAIRLEWISIVAMAFVITAVGLAAGQSQAMKTAFAEDLLSLLPPIAFLVGMWRVGKGVDLRHPYGHHRAIGAGHLVSAVALLGFGLSLVIDGAMTLAKGERPPIGAFSIAGFTFWSGWLMVGVMAISVVPPMILGRMKLKLSEPLHDKVLAADADMNKADWSTGLATIAGVLGIGMGLWWADSVAAIAVATSILKDGFTNVRAAVADLLDARATPIDTMEAHPVIQQQADVARAADWVDRAAVRVRDMGHVFHSEVFVVPVADHQPHVAEIEELRRRCQEVDWKTEDTVVVVTEHLPGHLVPPDQSSTSGTKT